MRNMGLHAERLHRAGWWFKLFSNITWGAGILVLVILVLMILSGQQTFTWSGVRTPTATIIGQGIGALITGLITGYLWRVAYFICDFLSDFASGLYAQQIARERRNAQGRHNG